MTKKLKAKLTALMNSGQSESIAVAECLFNIAENGGESDTDEFLLICAGEIADAAESLITEGTWKERNG